MRIGIFTDSYKPYVSGVVRSIETFKKELEKLGHEIFIFAPNYSGYKEQNNQIFRFPSFRSPTHQDFYIGIPLSFLAEKYITDLNLDLIHVHSPFVLGRVGASFARKLNIPLVFTYHTLYDQYVHYAPFAQGLARRVVISLARNFCNRCDLVITPTGVIRQLIQGYGVNKPIVAIPTGISPIKPLETKSFFLKEKLGLPKEEKILLFVGRLGKEKNVISLLNSFKTVLSQKQNVNLVLVGNGPEEKFLKEYAKKQGINSRVYFTGLLPYEEVVLAYLSADIFVFPSLTETQGLVLAEALSAGLPIVARAAYGSLAMVENGVTGYLCNNEEEFADKVIYFLQYPQNIAVMSKAARARADKLSALKMAMRLERVYQALIAKEDKALIALANSDVFQDEQDLIMDDII